MPARLLALAVDCHRSCSYALPQIGTIFWFGYAVAMKQATTRPRLQRAKPPLEAQPGAVPVVLIVEHDALLRLVTANSLRGSGFAVIEAANAFEAVLVLVSLPVDALISEIDLPDGMDGLALARWVCRRRLDTRIILTSGAERAPCGAEEHACFLPKPFTHRKVEGLLRRILPRHSAIPALFTTSARERRSRLQLRRGTRSWSGNHTLRCPWSWSSNTISSNDRPSRLHCAVKGWKYSRRPACRRLSRC